MHRHRKKRHKKRHALNIQHQLVICFLLWTQAISSLSATTTGSLVNNNTTVILLWRSGSFALAVSARASANLVHTDAKTRVMSSVKMKVGSRENRKYKLRMSNTHREFRSRPSFLWVIWTRTRLLGFVFRFGQSGSEWILWLFPPVGVCVLCVICCNR